MTDLDLGLGLELAVDVDPATPLTLEIGLGLDVLMSPVHTGKRWRVVAVQWNEGLEDWIPVENGWLADAVPGPITFEPCKPESWSFTMSALDPKSALFDPHQGRPYQSVQLWYGDRIVAFGYTTGIDWGDDGVVTVQVNGAAWPVTDRRFVGPAERQNMLSNGDFRQGGRFWQQAIADEFGTFVAPDGDTFILFFPGAGGIVPDMGQAFIFDVSPPEPEGHHLPYIAQDVRFNASHKAITATLHARAMVTEFLDANIRDTGLAMVLLPVGYSDVWTEGLAFATGSPSIGPDTPIGVLFDLSCSIEIPWSGNERIVQVRCEGCKGTIIYTDVWLEYTDSLRLSGDQAFVFLALFDHFSGNVDAPWLYSKQYPNYPWTLIDGYQKSDLLISVDAPDTGVQIYRDYQFVERGSGGQLLAEFANRDNGLEWFTRYTRNKREVFTQYGKLGHDRPDLRLVTANGRGNVASWQPSWMGEQGSSSISVSPINGGWRGGSAVDLSVFNGLTLEEDFAAPLETDRDNLDTVAARRLRAATDPTAASVLAPFELWDERGLMVGDRVPFFGARGGMRDDGTKRITKMTVTPGSPHLALDLVPWVA